MNVSISEEKHLETEKLRHSRSEIVTRLIACFFRVVMRQAILSPDPGTLTL